MGKNANIQFK
uniref:Uncharacterized protein n=1 Tax=Arundo donax TaxID=35708 RepID=A0A0A9AZQ3_ARUDO